MIDLHVHCEYSIDAEGAVGAYAEAAAGAGLTHLCFTTHCDLDPARLDHDGRVRLSGAVVDVYSNWLESYVSEVAAAADRFRGRMRVLCGLEVGYVPGLEGVIEKTAGRFDFDYLLCGIHVLRGIDIVSPRESGDYFKTRSPRGVCEDYFGYLEGAVASGLFDAVAHFDIYKRCGLEFYGDSLRSAHLGLAEPVLEEMARRDLCLEINSAGYRKGLGEPYPAPDILGAAAAAGVRHVVLGSDCHRPEDVGRDLDRCAALARLAGFDGVAVFEGRRRQVLAAEAI
jgi:histidinol-phosphatase (PHP family)